jgi:hypothetical protein
MPDVVINSGSYFTGPLVEYLLNSLANGLLFIVSLLGLN